MWFAENKSWSQFRRSLGGFSAIVCKQGNDVWAEDQYGKTIAQGEAGVDDASVIQSAVNFAPEGGQLFIKNEEYSIYETINIDKKLEIIGEQCSLLLKNESLSDLIKANFADFSPKNKVLISGLKLVGLKSDTVLLRISKCNCVIKNCIFEDTTYPALMAGSIHGSLISNNVFYKCKIGVEVGASNAVNIMNNWIDGAGESYTEFGIKAYNLRDLRIENNVIQSFRIYAGVGLTWNGYNCKIIHNWFEDNKQYGIWCFEEGASHSRIIRNYFEGSDTYDIKIDGGENYVIAHNYVCEGSLRINIESSVLNTVIDEFGYKNSGVATFSGDGSTTDFEIGAHGLVTNDASKIVVKITPVSQDAINASPCVGYVDPADNTKIRVKFSSAPASGSENVKIVWHAEVIS